MEPTSFELPIFAPVPAGHRVVVAGFRLTGGTSGMVDWLVVDRTSKVSFSPRTARASRTLLFVEPEADTPYR